MGFSTFNPAGDFRSFSQDVFFLLGELQISKSALLCWSGGGPFALATADMYPDVITGVYIITGFTRSFTKDIFKRMHGNKLYFAAANRIPGFTRLVLNIVSQRKPTMPIPRVISRLPASDHSLMTNIERLRQVSATTLKEACRNGSTGAVYEAQLYFRDFPFDLRNIEVPVSFWWGDQDNVVQQVHAKAIEEQVQNHKIYYKPNEGHFSIYIHFFEEVLQKISNSKQH
jgi:pimeloyl-ACP methyl ester carboxylesterase